MRFSFKSLKIPVSKFPYWAYILVVVSLIVNVFYIIGRHQTPEDGSSGKWVNDQFVITGVTAGSPADKAGIKEGDILLFVQSIPVKKDVDGWSTDYFKPGDILLYRLIQDGRELETRITISSQWAEHNLFYILFYSLALFISLTSIYILYKKPTDLSAKVFFVYLQIFILDQNTTTVNLDKPYAILASMAFILSYNLIGPVLIHFHLLFPKRSRLIERIPKLPWVFYLVGFLSGLIYIIFMFVSKYYPLSGLNKIYAGFYYWGVSWMGISLTLALGVAIYQYFTIREKFFRKQLKLIIIGSVFGLATPIIFSVFPDYFYQLIYEKHLMLFFEIPAAVGGYIMIAFLVTAIFRYRIWNIEFLIRQAILYTTATLITALTYLLLIYVTDLLTIMETRMTRFLILTASVIPFLLLRDLVQQMVARFFYRESYDSTIVLKDFEGKLAGIYNPVDLKTKISESMDEIFHFKSFVFMMNTREMKYEIAYAKGKEGTGFQVDFQMTPEMEMMFRKKMVLIVDELHEKSSLSDLFNAELIISIPGENQLFGFFFCGPKLSERPYSSQDIKVLSLLAQRITSLFRTAQLFQRDLEQQLMLERERARISQDMHDEVGASLTRISILSELAKKQQNEPVKTQQIVDQISEISGNVVDEMSEIIWAMNPRNDTLDSFTSYIRQYVSTYLESAGIDAKFSFPPEIPSQHMSSELRRNLFLILKEALHNTVKHSGAHAVNVKLHIGNELLEMQISDDGKGFIVENKKGTGNGLINMHKRIEDLVGQYTLTSEPGKGTIILLSVSLPIKVNSH